MSAEHERVAAWIAAATQGVAFTGAGISTESGIPDFRSPGGVWANNRQVYFDEFMDDADSRYEYWRQKSIAHQDFAGSEPNTGHRMLAKWQSEGYLRGVITQNIDGLHQDAGSQGVLELHGTARYVRCMDCNDRWPAAGLVQKFLAEDGVPPCPSCPSGRLKHDTISFGQSLDSQVLSQAVEYSQQSDLCLAIGSSLVVEPAASLPRMAKQNGARLVIINRDPTPLDDLADVTLNESIGEAVTHIDAFLP